jgi:hypothetical protein
MFASLEVERTQALASGLRRCANSPAHRRGDSAAEFSVCIHLPRTPSADRNYREIRLRRTGIHRNGPGTQLLGQELGRIDGRGDAFWRQRSRVTEVDMWVSSDPGAVPVSISDD